MSSEADFDLTNELSESQLDEIRLRRQRSDRISKIMSEYLLKGYRMLATNCPTCMNILMEDKQGRQFCIACEEIDIHPSTPASAQQHPIPRHDSTSSKPAEQDGIQQPSSMSIQASPVSNDFESILAALQEAKSVITMKLRATTKRLLDEERSGASIDHALAIKAFVEAISAINDAEKHQS